MDASQVVLLATVLLPFAGAGAVILLRKLPNAREGASLAAAVGTFALAGMSLPAAFQGGPVEVTLAEMLEGLSLSLRADGLGLLFAVLASFLWILTTVYSVGYMRGLKEHAQTRYFACFALVIGATMGVALSANLFSLFLFYEILTVATYPLVVHKETEEAFAAGRKYLVYTLTAGVAILAGMTLLQGMAGSVEFVAGGNPALAGLAPEFAKVAFVLLLGGFGVKAALVPLHGWLPTAMIAPTPVSGLLHAVAVVKAGVFGLLRTILFLFGPGLMVGLDLQVLVIVTACATILVGSLLALVQDDLKARLAYSTISALSYILLGAALVDPTTGEYPTAAIVGATFQIAAHAFAKLTMFFVAGAIAVETGKTRISELDGIGRRMPGTMVAFTVATIGMAGLPPLAGFLGKWYLGVGAWGAFGQDGWPLLLVLATSSVLNLAYFLPIVVRAFFGPSEGPRTEARGMILGPLLGTAVGGLVLGLWTSLPYGPFELARLIAADVTGAGPAAFTFVADLVLPVPPFLVFLIGAPLVLALKGRARQVALVGVAGLGLVDVILMPAVDAAWTVPFMDGELVLLEVRHLPAQKPVGTGLGHIEQPDRVHQGRLAGPGRSGDGDEFPGLDRQRDAAQRVHGRIAHAIRLVDVLELDQRRVHVQRLRVDGMNGLDSARPPPVRRRETSNGSPSVTPSSTSICLPSLTPARISRSSGAAPLAPAAGNTYECPSRTFTASLGTSSTSRRVAMTKLTFAVMPLRMKAGVCCGSTSTS